VFRSTVNVKLADYCSIDPSLVTLEKGAKDNLSSDDWKALIAAELCYKFQVKPQGHRRFVLRKALPASLITGFLGALVFITAILYLVIPNEWYGRPSIFVVTLAVFLAPLFIVGRLSVPGVRRDRTKADQVASEIVGKDKMLRALETAESLDEQDPDRARRLKYSRV